MKDSGLSIDNLYSLICMYALIIRNYIITFNTDTADCPARSRCPPHQRRGVTTATGVDGNTDGVTPIAVCAAANMWPLFIQGGPEGVPC